MSVLALLLAAGPGFAGSGPKGGWSREDVDWRATAGARIKGILYPPGSPPPARAEQKGAVQVHRRALSAEASSRPIVPSHGASDRQMTRTQQRPGAAAESGEPFAVSALVIDSPPIDGFVPYVAISATGQSTTQDEVARLSSTVGTLLPARQADFAIGLLDTGAGTFVMGHDAAVRLGVVGSLVTPYTVEINGVTGSVNAFISAPIGLYADGLSAIDEVSGVLNNVDMMGEWNIAVAVGPTPAPGQPDLPTVLGSPFAVYYAALVRPDLPLTRVVAGTPYTAPDITFYDTLDPTLPEYFSYIPLELRPLGGVNVQYVPCIDIFGSCAVTPTPSIIVGNSAQSLYFLGSVDLYDRQFAAMDRDRFMLDTGAQVTVIGKRTAARLSLNLNVPEFEVEIQGVDGQISIEPGFYLDRVEIPALGEWLSFTRVPVVVLDVASPEGGTLDGIIGMNLMTQYKFVLRGGGLAGQGGDPSLECELVAPLAINADFDGDNDVDMDDFGHFQACYTGPTKPQTKIECLGARMDVDSDVDEADLAIFAGCCDGPNIPAAVECMAP